MREFLEKKIWFESKNSEASRFVVFFLSYFYGSVYLFYFKRLPWNLFGVSEVWVVGQERRKKQEAIDHHRQKSPSWHDHGTSSLLWHLPHHHSQHHKKTCFSLLTLTSYFFSYLSFQSLGFFLLLASDSEFDLWQG